MKQILFIILIVIISEGCVSNTTRELPISDNNNSFQEVAKQFPLNANGDVKVVTIDSCEYIVWGGSHGEIGYAHKGNCKFCIDRQIKNIEINVKNEVTKHFTLKKI